MTSSLVGSEMCIRDRLWDGAAAATLLPRAAPLISLATLGDGTSASTSPVSYTHLTLPTICSV
eukprot:1457630-Prorocentrum_lima.AAC.1